jgi:cytochrome o ubiquinol oxidase operon protein cyoD
MLDTKKYFEEIGALPRGLRAIARAYAIGFALSLVLTFAAYYLTVYAGFPSAALVAALLAFACAQFAVQVICFLHLGGSSASRDKTAVLGVTTVIVVILVGGSLWIMTHLNERMMADPAAMQQYMDAQAGI